MARAQLEVSPAGRDGPVGRGGRRVRVLLSAVAVVVVGVAFGLVLPRVASYGEVWRVLRTLSLPWLFGLLAATALNVATFALPWMVVLPGLGFVDATRLTQASTAVTLVVPGGAAVGMGVSYAMLRSLRFARQMVGRAVALTGVWSQVSTFAFPLVAVLALAAEGEGGSSVFAVALAGGVVFAASVAVVAFALRSPRAARWACRLSSTVASFVRRLRGREPVTWSVADFDRFRLDVVATIGDRWISLTVATLANQLTGFLVFDLVLRATGIGTADVSIAESFTAWSLARLIASLPVTPGGLGLVELGLTGLLVGFGGPSARVVAAVLAYRVLSIVPTLALGLLAAATWRIAREGSPNGRAL